MKHLERIRRIVLFIDLCSIICPFILTIYCYGKKCFGLNPVQLTSTVALIFVGVHFGCLAFYDYYELQKKTKKKP